MWDNKVWLFTLLGHVDMSGKLNWLGKWTERAVEICSPEFLSVQNRCDMKLILNHEQSLIKWRTADNEDGAHLFGILFKYIPSGILYLCIQVFLWGLSWGDHCVAQETETRWNQAKQKIIMSMPGVRAMKLLKILANILERKAKSYKEMYNLGFSKSLNCKKS